MAPTFSVVIPTYNRADFLENALESVLTQTYDDLECIVVDDGSEDRTPDLLESVEREDDRVVGLRQSNAGKPAIVRNRGIEEASGEFVAFLDDDDEWLPHKLELQLETLREFERAGMTFGQIEYFEGKSGIWPDLDLPRFPSRERLLKGNFVPCSTVVVRREILEEVGGFDPDLTIGEDYELWVRIAGRADLCAMPEILARYRWHDEGFCRNRPEELDHLEHLYDTFEAKLGIPPDQLADARRDLARRRADAAETFPRTLWHRLRALLAG